MFVGYGAGTGFHIGLQVSDSNRYSSDHTLYSHRIPWTRLTDLV